MRSPTWLCIVLPAPGGQTLPRGRYLYIEGLTRKRVKMEGHLVVTVFQWKDRWHATADRVLPAPDRKYAPRRRVWSVTVEGKEPMSEWDACAFAAEALAELVRKG